MVKNSIRVLDICGGELTRLTERGVVPIESGANRK